MDTALGEPFRELVQPVERDEKVAPGKTFRVRRQSQIAFMDALRIKLVQIETLLRRAGRLEMIDDRQWHEHRTAPGTHLVEVHVEPFADENDLARNGGDVIPWIKAEQRQ